MATIDEIEVPLLQFAEDSAPGTPGSGIVRLYAKDDGLLYSKDDEGTETVVSGGGEGGGGGGGVPVMCLARNSTTQSGGGAGAVTAVTFDTDELDAIGMHDTGSNTSRFTVPSGRAGWWRFTFQTWWNTTSGARQCFFKKNGAGAEIGMPAEATQMQRAMLVIDLDESDYVEAYVYHDTGTINIGHASAVLLQTQMVAEFLGPAS